MAARRCAAIAGGFSLAAAAESWIAQQPGVDFQLVERSPVFPHELVPEVKMTRMQWTLVTVGIGDYRKHDSVDVIYEKDVRRLVATGLQAR
jgi:hypothetical protein